MTYYRAYVIGQDGHCSSLPRAFFCDTDENAIVWARQLLDDQIIELWSGACLVKRLIPSELRPEIAHEMHNRRRAVSKGKE
jgi:hypothetical protein